MRPETGGSLDDQLQDLLDLGSDQYELTDWEIDFIETLSKTRQQGRVMSDRQATVLCDLWSKAFTS